MNVQVEEYGVDLDGLISENEDENVDIPETNPMINALKLQNLQDTINPLANSKEFGINIFVKTKL